MVARRITEARIAKHKYENNADHSKHYELHDGTGNDYKQTIRIDGKRYELQHPSDKDCTAADDDEKYTDNDTRCFNKFTGLCREAL